MTPRPLIGVTAIPRTVHAGFGTYWGQTLADNFVKAIEEAGGVPVILPSTQPELAAGQVAPLDALVLSGGADVRPEMAWLDEHRDAWELAVLDAAAERRLPILGICRGSQLLNVWRGGQL